MHLSDFVGRPLAIDRAYLDCLLAALESGNPSALVAGERSRPRSQPGVVELSGVLTPEPTLLSRILGWTSLREFRAELDAALANPNVTSVEILVNSPGGDIAGISETMDYVHAARSRKPINAYVTGLGASAAYFVISGASNIYTADSGLLGSIGIVRVEHDDRGLQERVGVRRHEVVSSGAPHKRLDLATQEGRAVIQQQVNDLEGVFVAKIARFRGVTEDKVLTNFGKGGLLVGQKAVLSGMADGVRNFADGVAPSAGATAASAAETTEAIESRCRAAWERDVNVRAEFADLKSYTAYEKAMASGRPPRILGEARGQESIAHPKVNAQATDEELEVRCRATWERDANIRAEFADLKSYTAFTKAEARGRVRVHGGGVYRGSSGR